MCALRKPLPESSSLLPFSASDSALPSIEDMVAGARKHPCAFVTSNFVALLVRGLQLSIASGHDASDVHGSGGLFWSSTAGIRGEQL